MPSFVRAADGMRLVGAAAVLIVIAMVLLTPERASLLKHEAAALDAAEAARLAWGRIGLSLVALAVAFYAFRHRDTVSWRPFQWLLFALPLLGIALVAAYKASFGVRDAKYLRLIREDGPVEYATALFFLVAAAVAVWALLRARDAQARAFLGLLAFATLFVGLSEVSFGQRIVGIETPASFAEINRQGEITLHNIKGVDGIVYMYVPLILLAYALFGAPIAQVLSRSRYAGFFSADLLRIAPAPWYASPYFFPMAIFCIKAWLIRDHVWQDQEPSELMLSVGFLLIAVNAALVLAPAPGGAAGRAGQRPPQHSRKSISDSMR